jgi:hypothetical protein
MRASLEPAGATTQKGPREEIEKETVAFCVSYSTRRSTSSLSIWEFTDSRILRFCFVFSSLSPSLWLFIKLKINQKVKDRNNEILSGYASHRVSERERERIEKSNKVQSSDKTSFIVV